MKVIGIIGGIGSGKSSVSSVFVQNGAVILDADRAGHLVLLKPAIKKKLLERFGIIIFEPIIDANNNKIDNSGNKRNLILETARSAEREFVEKNIEKYSINRRQLATFVFSSTEEGQRNLAFLNALVHPEIARELQKQKDSFEKEKKELVILDAPLILEAGWSSMADYLVFVETNEETRWNRVQKRNWSRQELKNREAAQMPLTEKRKFADFIIDNNQLWDQMVGQVENIIKIIRNPKDQC